MNKIEKALETQVKNLQERSGKSLDEIFAMLRESGLSKHGEMRDMLKSELRMGHGDANTAAHLYRATLEDSAASAEKTADPVDDIYSGKKAALRPIHDKLMKAIEKFGAFEIAPKKSYVSLRRSKQFAMIGPATQSQVEVGLNVKDLEASNRLKEQPASQMCQYKVRVASVEEVDKELIAWLKAAYKSAE